MTTGYVNRKIILQSFFRHVPALLFDVFHAYKIPPARVCIQCIPVSVRLTNGLYEKGENISNFLT